MDRLAVSIPSTRARPKTLFGVVSYREKGVSIPSTRARPKTQGLTLEQAEEIGFHTLYEGPAKNICLSITSALIPCFHTLYEGPAKNRDLVRVRNHWGITPCLTNDRFFSIHWIRDGPFSVVEPGSKFPNRLFSKSFSSLTKELTRGFPRWSSYPLEDTRLYPMRTLFANPKTEWFVKIL